MLRWLKGKGAPKPPAAVTFRFAGNPSASERDSRVQEGETREALFDEFARTFCHRPGENFVQEIQRVNAYKLLDWLSPKSGEAESMAFVSLAVDATRMGIRFWEQSGIVGFRLGGEPPRRSVDALSVLAQSVGIPIKLYWETPEGDTRLIEFST